MGDDPSQSHLDLLKDKISLSNSDLYELAYNHQRFMGTVRKFNNEAKNKIDFEMPQEALIYLAEAERVLEYAASCGKNIDRNLIICVLHNEACCYQKSWDLEKCSNYLQALIYNFQCSSDTVQTSPRSQDSHFKQDSEYSEQLQINELLKKPWSHRIHLCKYELQFCAINSQLRNHKTALSSGRRSIKLIKSIFRELQKIGQEYYLPIDQKDSLKQPLMQQPFEDFQAKMKIIQGICSIDDTPNINSLQEYLITTKYYLSKWNIRKLEVKNQSLKDSLRNFSIGSVMQLKPLSFEENRQSTIDIQKWLQNAYEQKSQTQILKSETYEKILNKVLLLSMGYFTIATQMRLISNEKFKKSQEAKRQSRQYKQSQIYHLISLIISCVYVPYDMLYMRHILASFNNHYPMSIDSSFPLSCEQKVMKKNFDILRLADERQKKKSRMATENEYEKSIRISDSNLLDDRSMQKSTRTSRKQSKQIKFKKQTSTKRKQQKNGSKSKKNSNSKRKQKETPFKGAQKLKRIKSEVSEDNSAIKKLKAVKSKQPNNPFQSKSRSILKSSGKLSSKNKQAHDPLKIEGNEYFDNIKRKNIVGKGKKGKSKQKRGEKSKQKNCGQLKKNIDKYYF